MASLVSIALPIFGTFACWNYNHKHHVVTFLILNIHLIICSAAVLLPNPYFKEPSIGTTILYLVYLIYFTQDFFSIWFHFKEYEEFYSEAMAVHDAILKESFVRIGTSPLAFTCEKFFLEGHPDHEKIFREKFILMFENHRKFDLGAFCVVIQKSTLPLDIQNVLNEN